MVNVIMIDKSRIIEQIVDLFSRLGKIVNKKKLQAEGFGKYFNKRSGKLGIDVDLSDKVVPDGNKSVDGVRYMIYNSNLGVNITDIFHLINMSGKIHPVSGLLVTCKHPI